MATLYLIPARGGSKGIPGKNIKTLCGKPLILYSIETARELADDCHICVSTDSDETISIVRQVGLDIPFVRPPELSSDFASSRDVVNHALSFFSSQGRPYERVILLQPTSPFRLASDIEKMSSLMEESVEMVVSVREVKNNPYYNLYWQGNDGFLKPVESATYSRRQDIPKLFAYNGSVYVIRARSIKEKDMSAFDKVLMYEMDEIRSIDIDTSFDWMVAEMVAKKGLRKT